MPERDSSHLMPRTALPHDVLRVALDAIERGQRVVVASVIARHGSAPSTPGQKLCLVEDLTAVGTVGGGAVEKAVLGAMSRALDDPASTPKVETFRLGPSLGMCCGGSVDILIEPLLPASHVLVVGAGHIGTFAAPLLASLGFQVTLCDARSAAIDASRSTQPAPVEPAPVEPAPPASGRMRVLQAEHDDPEVLAGLPRDAEGAVVLVMTHDHSLDQAVIAWALARGFGFVGGVGSRAKATRTRSRLEAKGVSERDIARVRMPVGIDIGARTPAEISVAIAAELIDWRAQRLRARWANDADGRAGAVGHTPDGAPASREPSDDLEALHASDAARAFSAAQAAASSGGAGR